MAHETSARISCHYAALVFDFLRYGEIIVFLVEMGADAAMLVLDIAL